MIVVEDALRVVGVEELETVKELDDKLPSRAKELPVLTKKFPNLVVCPTVPLKPMAPVPATSVKPLAPLIVPVKVRSASFEVIVLVPLNPTGAEKVRGLAPLTVILFPI